MTHSQTTASTPTGNDGQPPSTIEGLRELMIKVGRGQSDIHLGPKALAALGKILNLQGDPALFSITTLADRLEVNASTITRLARNLGYPGFSAFQEVLIKASISSPGEFYSKKAQQTLQSRNAPSLSKVSQLCHESQANIDRLIETFDITAFDHAVSMITNAPRICLYGIRQFHAFASFLTYGLRMIRSDVNLLDSNALGLAEGMAQYSSDDLFIAGSCAPYSVQTVKAAQAAHEHGMQTLVITDTLASPLVRFSDEALFSPHQTSFISNSISTFMLLAECIINGCAAAAPAATQKAIEDRDRLIKLMQIEM